MTAIFSFIATADINILPMTQLTILRVQGKFFCKDSDLMSEAVSALSDREMRFAYNATIDTLLTDANLALWYRGQVSAQCKLCGFPTQTLKHVPNNCHVAMDQHRFDRRHDSVLSVINTFITSHVSSQHVLADHDLPGEPYSFPTQIAASQKRPDIMIWKNHLCMLIKQTAKFKENLQIQREGRETAMKISYVCAPPMGTELQ